MVAYMSPPLTNSSTMQRPARVVARKAAWVHAAAAAYTMCQSTIDERLRSPVACRGAGKAGAAGLRPLWWACCRRPLWWAPVHTRRPHPHHPPPKVGRSASVGCAADGAERCRAYTKHAHATAPHTRRNPAGAVPLLVQQSATRVGLVGLTLPVGKVIRQARDEVVVRAKQGVLLVVRVLHLRESIHTTQPRPKAEHRRRVAWARGCVGSRGSPDPHCAPTWVGGGRGGSRSRGQPRSLALPFSLPRPFSLPLALPFSFSLSLSRSAQWEG